MSRLAQLDKRHLWHPFTNPVSWTRDEPLIIERAEGNYLIDEQGRRYLDGVSSLWTNVHGHRCEDIDRALTEQLGKVAHSTLLGLSNPAAIELAAALAEVSPPGLERVFFSDSGSTAVEVALKLAFQYWQLSGKPQKTHFVALENAYHGDTLGSVSVGGIQLFHKIFQPLLFHTFHIPAPSRHYCSPQLNAKTDLAEASLLALQRVLREQHHKIAALIIEPRVQGAAGILLQPLSYLQRVAELCRQHEVLLVCDEVATGFGRTGELFASAAATLRPDLMAVAKGISGGYLPLAATLATEPVYQAFCRGEGHTFFHGHTYTGNPLACAAGLASLRRFQRQDLLTTVRLRADQLASALSEHVAPLPHVGEIRQCGLMVGVELCRDKAARQAFEPTVQVGARVCQAVRGQGVILRNLGDVVVLMPPLAVTSNELTLLCQATALAIRETTDHLSDSR